jgi:4-amino-4-deoxy-L-arabinose transferase-like glycosyltransferase
VEYFKENINEIEQNHLFNKIINSNKTPWFVTISFFVILLAITIIHHPHWVESEADGLYFLNIGKQFLSGDGANIKLVDAPIGGPIIFASLDLIFHDGFNVEKIISLLSGTGIVFFSYYIIRNIFSAKIALIGQLFVAFNPRLEILSMSAINGLLPIFLIFMSLYFVTKDRTRLLDYALCGVFLGISFMIRYQALPVLLGVLIFLLIRNKNIKLNFKIALIVLTFFIFAVTPLVAYNLTTFDKIIDSEPNVYPTLFYSYQTLQWHEYMENAVITNEQMAIFNNSELFLKNYSDNLFYKNPNILFNFGTLSSASIIPLIPFIILIPVFGGLMYLIKFENKKKPLIGLSIVALISTLFVISTNSPQNLYAILILPIIFLVFYNFKKIKPNIVALLVITTVYSLFMGIVPLAAAEHVFPIWILIPMMSSLFFVVIIKEILKKFSKNSLRINKTSKILSISFIVLILLMNLGVTVKSFENIFYDGTFTSFENEIFELFDDIPLEKRGLEEKIIGNILKEQEGIENSYVMGSSVLPTYYANSKFLFTYFQEGEKSDTMDEFLKRENWSEFQIFISNIVSNPNDRYNIENPIPEYLIYNENHWLHPWFDNDLRVLFEKLGNPANSPNFEKIYQSNKTGTVVYKINYLK